MSVVDSASISPADVVPARRPELQEWALSRTSARERAVAIELVLAHDFDEPFPAASAGESPHVAQSVREQILMDLTGIGSGRPALMGAASGEATAQRPPVRTRSASPEGRPSRFSAGTRRR